MAADTQGPLYVSEFLNATAWGDCVRYSHRGGAWVVDGARGASAIRLEDPTGAVKMESLLMELLDNGATARFIMSGGHRLTMTVSRGQADGRPGLRFCVDEFVAQTFALLPPAKPLEIVSSSARMALLDSFGRPAAGRGTMRSWLVSHGDESWRCGMGAASGFVEGFLVEGVPPSAVAGIEIFGSKGQHSCFVRKELWLSHASGLYVPAGAWAHAVDPALGLPPEWWSEISVRFQAEPEACPCVTFAIALAAP